MVFAGIVRRIHWRDGLYHIAGCDVIVRPVLVRPRILPSRIPPRARHRTHPAYPIPTHVVAACHDLS